MGIYVGGTGSANHIDDYEEGFWTPSIDGLSNTPSFYNIFGNYTRIGRLVKIHGHIQVGGTKPQFSTLNDTFKVSGLPFNSAAANGQGYQGCHGTSVWQQLNWCGGQYSSYGHGDDTVLSPGISNLNKVHFTTCGQAVYYTGNLINRAVHNNTGWNLEWDMSYISA